MQIRRYEKADEKGVFDLMRAEGKDWACYYAKDAAEQYKFALESSITYVCAVDDEICGFVRCRDDDSFGVYVHDLLVAKPHRGRNYGKKLMERVCADYPSSEVYVMSDVDPYYEKLGLVREGSVFRVQF